MCFFLTYFTEASAILTFTMARAVATRTCHHVLRYEHWQWILGCQTIQMVHYKNICKIKNHHFIIIISPYIPKNYKQYITHKENNKHNGNKKRIFTQQTKIFTYKPFAWPLSMNLSRIFKIGIPFKQLFF